MSDTILLSGGFDPVHIGHVRMMEAARELGHVVVALNSDEWLMRKKGYVFMPWEERAYIIRSFEFVDEVVAFDDSDDTACDAVRHVAPTYFGNGGDRVYDNTPESSLCEEMGVVQVWGLGGGKIQSSSDLVASAAKARGDDTFERCPTDDI